MNVKISGDRYSHHYDHGYGNGNGYWNFHGNSNVTETAIQRNVMAFEC